MQEVSTQAMSLSLIDKWQPYTWPYNLITFSTHHQVGHQASQAPAPNEIRPGHFP
jgi:hypothetical protein